jgi:hypothetical protein
MWCRHVVEQFGFFLNFNSMPSRSPGALRSDYIASAGLWRGPASADGSWCPLEFAPHHQALACLVDVVASLGEGMEGVSYTVKIIERK